MLETTALPFLAVLSLLWSAFNLSRRNTAVAGGALVMSLVTGLAWFAHSIRLDVWLEGGFGMSVLAIIGGYALGSAVAHRSSRSRGAFIASVAAASLMIVSSAAFFRHAMAVPEDIVRDAAPEIRALILNASRGEAMRLLQLAAGLLAAVGLTLVLPPPVASSPVIRSFGHTNARSG